MNRMKGFIRLLTATVACCASLPGPCRKTWDIDGPAAEEALYASGLPGRAYVKETVPG